MPFVISMIFKVFRVFRTDLKLDAALQDSKLQVGKKEKGYY
jgi:hypothetical protein